MGNFDFGWLQKHLGIVVITFIIAQLVILGIAWRNLSKRTSWHTHTNTWASILTVIGIFGTFFGIFIGLQAFKIKDIEGSIPDLLEGLKLAFLTSLLGILSAIILKWKGLYQTQKIETSGEINLSSELQTLITAIKEDGETTRNVLHDMRNGIINEQRETLNQLGTLTNTVSDKSDLIITSQANEATETRKILTDMQSELTDRQDKTVKQLQMLTETVSDEHNQLRVDRKTTRGVLESTRDDLINEQSKILEQLGTLTNTVSDEHNQLRKEFETFSKNVAESITELATKELISSLTQVIENFNTQLSTQFGDNFKQLNEAVGRTVEWQEQYRQQMNQLAKEFQIAANSIDDSRGSLENIAVSSSTIADRSASITGSAEKLEPILHTLNDQLGAFSDLRQKATDAFPIIEERLDDLTTKFSGTVQKAITDSQEQSKKLATQYDEFQKVIAGLDDFTTKIDGVTTDTSKIITDLQASIESQTKALQNSASYVTTMQQKLDEQLTASISALGTNLASLSQQFADDYTPLTQSLREVLTIADGILPKQLGN